jgi:hypothetical protein
LLFIQDNFNMRLKFIIAISLLFIIKNSISQTKQDYFEYVKEHVETSPALDNYLTYIMLGTSIPRDKINRFTGTNLSDEQYQNLFIYHSKVYKDEYKTNKMLELIRYCDLRGIRKVSSVKKSNSEGTYYAITLYIKAGYLCRVYKPEDLMPENQEDLLLHARINETTANNVKKALINLAKLAGSTNVIDGDALFGN